MASVCAVRRNKPWRGWATVCLKKMTRLPVPMTPPETVYVRIVGESDVYGYTNCNQLNMSIGHCSLQVSGSTSRCCMALFDNTLSYSLRRAPFLCILRLQICSHVGWMVKVTQRSATYHKNVHWLYHSGYVTFNVVFAVSWPIYHVIHVWSNHHDSKPGRMKLAEVWVISTPLVEVLHMPADE